MRKVKVSDELKDAFGLFCFVFFTIIIFLAIVIGIPVLLYHWFGEAGTVVGIVISFAFSISFFAAVYDYTQ